MNKYILELGEEFRRRKSKNKRYSLRAFARDLKIPATTLSGLLNGKHRPSSQTVGKLRAALLLSADSSEAADDLLSEQDASLPPAVTVTATPGELFLIWECIELVLSHLDRRRSNSPVRSNAYEVRVISTQFLGNSGAGPLN